MRTTTAGRRASAAEAVPVAAKGSDSFVHDTLVIRKQQIPIRVGELRHADLLYYADNPRVYSVVRNGAAHEPTQEEIQQTLQEMDHVKELVHQIRENGGLIDPLYVRGGTLDVIEGNSRLAAYRILATKDPIRWARVKCALLPDDIDESVISALLGQWHLRGKKEWPPFEQAGYLYRRHMVHGVAIDDLAAGVGLSRAKVRRLVEAYAFMVKHDDTQRERWSYYDEFIKSRKISKARDLHPEFEELVVAQIKSGEIPRAQDLRDKLPVICEGPPKVLRGFSTGRYGFEEAFDRAVEAGGDHSHYQKLTKFRKWLAQQDVRDALSAADGPLRPQITFEVRQLLRILGNLQKNG
ncbi:MAG TPA: ParB N-terminal domain-containing protein [Longimicrobium sp.]